MAPITRPVKCNRSEMEVDGVQEEGGTDTEVRRSCRLRRNRYKNQSVLFDKLITK